MNHTPRTLGFVIAAAVLILAAYFSVPSVPSPAAFNDVGEVFFPEFTDHTAAASLTVVEFKDTGLNQFRVERENEVWRIPSHHGYPADAKDRMAKAAAIFIGLRKDAVVSDSVEDHAQYGVLDPEGGKGEPGERGMRVTFQDAGQNTLASLIIGKAVEGKEMTRYARLPEQGKRRTYMVKLPAEISAEFQDWIESDLLEVTSHEVQSLTFANYNVVEDAMGRATLADADKVVEVGKVGGEWAMLGLAPDQEVDRDALTEVATTLDNLTIVGVRKKPEGLSANLRKADGIEVTQQASYSLRQRGFFMTQDGTLYANEGDLIAKTQKGVVYTLRFGEILVGSGDDVTAGSAAEGEKAADNASAPEEGLQANRFLMVTVAFDASLLDRPDGPALAEDHMKQRADARAGIDKLVASIEQYKNNNGAPPQTLAQLTEGEAPILTSIDKDPWGAEYGYSVDAEGGTYTVVCYAADGAEGGGGVDMDIVSTALAAEDQLKANVAEHEAFQAKVKEGEELATRLRSRFAPWYYVIDDESFKKLRRTKDQVVKVKEPTSQPSGG